MALGCSPIFAPIVTVSERRGQSWPKPWAYYLASYAGSAAQFGTRPEFDYWQGLQANLTDDGRWRHRAWSDKERGRLLYSDIG